MLDEFHIIFDPPWGTFSTTRRKDGIATNYECPAWGSVDAFYDFCCDAMEEARRILKPKGILIVKCQDAVNGGKKHWITHKIRYDAEIRCNFDTVDQIVQVQKTDPKPPRGIQRHVKMKHSVYWVFRKR